MNALFMIGGEWRVHQLSKCWMIISNIQIKSLVENCPIGDVTVTEFFNPAQRGSGTVEYVGCLFLVDDVDCSEQIFSHLILKAAPYSCTANHYQQIVCVFLSGHLREFWFYFLLWLSSLTSHTINEHHFTPRSPRRKITRPSWLKQQHPVREWKRLVNVLVILRLDTCWW